MSRFTSGQMLDYTKARAVKTTMEAQQPKKQVLTVPKGGRVYIRQASNGAVAVIEGKNYDERSEVVAASISDFVIQ